MTTVLDWTHSATLLLVCVVLAIAAISDVRQRRIPNWTVLAVAALFGVWACVEPNVSLLSAFGAAAVAFLISCALYFFGIVGAGDSKFVTVVALFAGLAHLPQFILYMSLAGGLLAIGMLVAEPAKLFILLHTRGRVRVGISVPYGVAIAAAGAMVLLMPQPLLFT